jgi:hypothetical protein
MPRSSNLSLSNSLPYSSIFQEGQKKSKQNISHDSCSPSQALNLELPEYAPTVIHLIAAFDMQFLIKRNDEVQVSKIHETTCQQYRLGPR